MPSELVHCLTAPDPAATGPVQVAGSRTALARWRAGLVGAVALLVAAWGAWFFRDHRDALVDAVSRLGPSVFFAALALTFVSLGLRVWRWRLILAGMGHALPWWLQMRTYLAGLALSSTPGKLGEASRAVLLGVHGVPAARSVGAFLCDRLADVVGVAALGVVSARLIGQRQIWMELVLLLSAAGGLALALFWVSAAGSSAGQRALLLLRDGAWVHQLGSVLTAWAKSWAHWRVGPWLMMAAVAYGLQALVFWLFVSEVHAGVGLALCVKIFTSSILIGAASLVPGGLGAMDAALVWQLQSAGVPTEAALVATLATRACTLWLAWLVGLLAWASFSGERGTSA